MNNFWIDMNPQIKIDMLKKAVENGYLKQEFAEEFIHIEEEKINEEKK